MQVVQAAESSVSEPEYRSVEEVEVTLDHDEDVKPIKKLLPSIGMIVFFLSSILFYVRYRKKKLDK